MKLSQYNTTVPFNGKFIFHNSLTQRFIYIDPFLVNLLENLTQENRLGELQRIHTALFDELVKNGFLVNDDDLEYERAILLIKNHFNRNDVFRLIVNPTTSCNFKCWYCYEKHSKNTKMDSSTIEKVKLLISNIINDELDLKIFQLSFFGGEPLLRFTEVVIPLIEYAEKITNEKGIKLLIDFTSNGYLINEKKLALLISHKVNSFQISFDGNKENHDKSRYPSKGIGSYDRLVKNIKLLIKNDIKVTMRINYTEKNLVGLDDLLNSFSDLSLDEKIKITISMNKVWQEENKLLGEEVSNFKELAKKLGFRIPDAFEGDRVRNPCYADRKNEAVVNYNGDMFKCNARDFLRKNREGILNDKGIIKWNKKHAHRLSAKLTNKPCMKCSIFPICGGGCSQQSLEYYEKDYCVNHFDNKIKHDLIIGMFLSENLKKNQIEKNTF